jgi:exopolysaccharide biosynthesis polyprenyl glycosylphosphotransferase
VVNRSLAVAFLGSTFLLMFVAREILTRWRRFQYDSGQGRTRILLVGESSEQLQTFVKGSQENGLPPFFVGLLQPPPKFGGTYASSAALHLLPTGLRADVELPPVLGALEDLEKVLHKEAIDEVLFFPPNHWPERVAGALELCEVRGIPARFMVEMPKPTLAAPQVVSIHEQPFISFELAPKSPTALAVKHAFDVLFAALALIALSPVLLLATLAIWVTMGRPIFFVQDRAGLYGRKFRMLKFRTMVQDAEAQKETLRSQNEVSGPVFKLSKDPRITPVGRWLRKSSVDELPQLLHVFLGEMSLVGPRPLPIREQSQIRGWHRRRLSMKPGLTGIWQVSGRSNIDFEEWMRLDLVYVDHWSLSLDATLLLKTVPAVLSGRGAI